MEPVSLSMRLWLLLISFSTGFAINSIVLIVFKTHLGSAPWYLKAVFIFALIFFLDKILLSNVSKNHLSWKKRLGLLFLFFISAFLAIGLSGQQ
jgi:hypothetical protein